jgi:uncharacterized protein involved in exopolysaccharide biosynthesis
LEERSYLKLDNRINKDIEYSFLDIFRGIFRKKGLFFITLFLVIIITILFIFFSPKKYEAYMVIQMNKGESSSTPGLSEILSGDISSSGNKEINTHIERMKNDIILKDLVEEYDLVDSTNNNRSLYMKIMDKYVDERDMINSLKNNFDIDTYIPSDISKDSNLIRIAYESSNPEFSYNIVKSLFNKFSEYDKEEYFAKVNKNIENLMSLMNKYRDENNKYTKEMVDYAIENKIDVNGDNSLINSLMSYYSEIYKQLLSIEEKKNKNNISIKKIEDNLLKLDKETKNKLIISNNSEILKLKNRIIESSIKLEVMKINTPNSPEIPNISSEIEILNKELENQIKYFYQDNEKLLLGMDYNKYIEYVDLKVESETFDLQKNTFINLQKEIENRLKDISPKYTEFLKLKELKTEAETKYTTILKTLETERNKTYVYDPTFKIVNDVFIPNREIFPNKKKSLVIGIIFAVFLGFVLALISDLKDSKVKNIDLFEKVFGRVDFFVNKNNYLDEAKKVASFLAFNSNKNIYLILNTKNKVFFSKVEDFYLDFNLDKNFLNSKDINKKNLINNNFSFNNIIYSNEINSWIEQFLIPKAEKILIFVEEKNSNIDEIIKFVELNNNIDIRFIYLNR